MSRVFFFFDPRDGRGRELEKDGHAAALGERGNEKREGQVEVGSLGEQSRAKERDERGKAPRL